MSSMFSNSLLKQSLLRASNWQQLAMTSALPPTALSRDYPHVANLSRAELESLLGSHGARAGSTGWDQERPWYVAQQGRHDGPSGASFVPAAPPHEEQAFEALIESMPEVQALRQESQRLLKLSEEKAARNATLQPDLEGLRAETQHLYDRARHFEAQWPQVQVAMNEAYKRFSPSALHFGLTQSASKLHEESESLASAFAEGLPLDVASTSASIRGLTPPESGAATPTQVVQGDGTSAAGNSGPGNDAAFVRRYRALRTTYHRRNLMAERWARGAVTWRDD